MRNTDKIRNILNILFYIGVVATIILYIATDGGKPYFYTGAVTLSIKILEYILRFIY